LSESLCNLEISKKDKIATLIGMTDCVAAENYRNIRKTDPCGNVFTEIPAFEGILQGFQHNL
ncbi:MAG: hypothetical protein JRN15_23490, partial [Nitrososphaerota archaeon]|nr:hypothetical protein [Nitrososphaerota archaeon]